jgi:hypothetical protein
MRDFEGFGFEEEEHTPWYIRRLMDRDAIHMSIDDLEYDIFEGEDWIDRVSSSNSDLVSVNSDSIMYLLTPCALRVIGYNPLSTLKDYKLRAMDLIRSIAPIEIKNSIGSFRVKVQNFLNRCLDSLYYCINFDEAKGFVGEILCFLGADYPLEAISIEDVTLYNTSYVFFTKILYVLGRFDLDEFRYENKASYYIKKVPAPSLWDYRDFLKTQADFVVSSFYKSFLRLKENGPSDKKWVEIYDEAEHMFSLVTDELLVRVPSVSARNQKGEVWELQLPDFFYSEVRKKLTALSELVPVGLREEFVSFHISEQVQKIVNSRVFYRPWIKK